MKHIAICFAAMLGSASFLSASPLCVTGTLASYEALGAGGCKIGTNTVFDFNSPTGITGATPIALADIKIIPSGGTASPTLTFETMSDATNGVLLEALLDYSITGNSYTSDTITLTGTSSGGNGAATDIQNYCLGGSFDSSGVNNCSSGNSNSLLNLGNGSDSGTFTPTPLLNVTDDFTLDSGGPGSDNFASGGIIKDAFTAQSAVPEPAGYLFLALGTILIVLRNKFIILGKEMRK